MAGTSRATQEMMHLMLLVVLSLSGWSATLSPQTEEAFAKYVRSQEDAMNRGFTPRWPHLGAGTPHVDAGGRTATLDVPDGLIHDWVAAGFAPGATLEGVSKVLRDYNRHAEIYSPEVVKSRLVSANGNRYHTFLRLRKKKVITVELNTEYDVEYQPVDARRAKIRIRSRKVAEIEDPGEPDEKELPPGTGYGFLWHLNSYWQLEERDGGVYLECRAISLSRDIPTGLGWAVRPMVTSLPRESLEKTISATLQAAK